ncbi:MAG TPA: pirin family protein [Alphaproteobacteria bacterium]|nr:pirin family protein [Alphaproteobacteria bacterium]
MTIATETGTGLESVIIPRLHDLGGFEVRRALPSAERRMIGSFVFLDQMGPARFPPGRGIDVRPHPHIGLATVTYLFAGEIFHRDTLGSAQAIRAGEINWMTAGRGIAHSERTDAPIRAAGGLVSGLQTWVGLPRTHEETEPSFAHHGTGSLPVVEGDRMTARILIGSAFGAKSPVKTFSEMIYADMALKSGAQIQVPGDVEERGLYIVEGPIEIGGASYAPSQLLVLKPGAEIIVAAPGGARVMLLGGEPLDGPRHLWWNFVSSSKERIEAAKRDWKEGRFGKVPGDDEFIPLPE